MFLLTHVNVLGSSFVELLLMELSLGSPWLQHLLNEKYVAHCQVTCKKSTHFYSLTACLSGFSPLWIISLLLTEIQYFFLLPLLVPIVSAITWYPLLSDAATKPSFIEVAGVRMGLGWMDMVDFERRGRAVMESRGGWWRGLVQRLDTESAGRRHLLRGVLQCRSSQ